MLKYDPIFSPDTNDMNLKLTLLSIVFLLFSCSCSHHETFIVEGNIRDVKDSAVVVMLRFDDVVSGHAIGEATDTLVGGKFRFELPVGDETDQYGVLFVGESYPQHGPTVFAEAGKKAVISGRGYLASAYDVKSRVKSQREWNRFIAATRSDLELDDRMLLETKKYASYADYRNARDSVSTSIFQKELPILKKMDVSDVWMQKVQSHAKYLSQFKDGSKDALKEELRSLLDKCTEGQMNTDLMVSAARFLSVIVPLSLGDRFPDVTVHDADGLSRVLSEFKGNELLVEFSELGCHPCVLAKPEIERICFERKDDFFALCINMNSYDTWKPRAEEYAPANMLEFNEDEGNRGVYARLGTGAVPTFVLVDKDFVIKDIWVGYGEGSIQERVR